MKTDKKELSVYIHIPFCKRKCLYCDFLSAPSDRTERENYVKALLCEIKNESKHFRESIVTTIFFGGGTPSILTGGQVKLIVDQVRRCFPVSSSAEITIEVNPGTITSKKLEMYRKAGVNRLSIGLQSTHNDELRALGRIHTFGQFLKTFESSRKMGFQNINVDLMSALPRQNMETYTDTLQKVLDLNPEHISAYSLIIEEGTPFYEWYGENAKPSNMHSPLPDEDTEREMYDATKRMLKEYEYHRYEISNYSKKGYECRHNLSYWTGKDYVGFGTGAASYFNDIRYSNLRDTKKYIEKMKEGGIDSSIKENILHLSKKDKIEEYMFVGLRLCKGVSISNFQKQFGNSMNDIYGGILERLSDKKLLSFQGDYVRLTKRGMNLSNYVLAEFLLDI